MLSVSVGWQAVVGEMGAMCVMSPGRSDGGRNVLSQDQGVAAAVGSVRLRCRVRSWRCWLVAGEATAPWRARRP